MTVIGLLLPRLAGGAAVTETVFSWPGMGRLAVGAAFEGDYPTIGSALVVVVPAEMLLGELGVGYLTWIEWNNLHIAGILFAILVIGTVGVALDVGFNCLARLVTYPE